MKIELAKPEITQKDIDEVVKVLKSGILSIGPKIKEFEQKIAEYVGVKYAVAVNSGTSALNLIMKSIGICDGDEVITTPFSFVASANCFIMEGAKPVFIDIDPLTLNMNLDNVEEKITEKTKAILAVDVFGQPINMLRLREICDRHKLYLIEDSCEAIGSAYAGYRAGSLADAATFAFYPNKQITTGEGGIIATNDEKIAEVALSLRSQGRSVTGFWLYHERIGYNFRMSELQAALGCAQMERIDKIILQRQKVAAMYNEVLKEIKEITLPYIHPDVTSMSWFVYVIQLDESINREVVMKYLMDNGVGCRPYFTPIHIQPYMVKMFGYEEGSYPITADIGRRSIALPFFNSLSIEQIKYVAGKIIQGILFERKFYSDEVASTTDF